MAAKQKTAVRREQIAQAALDVLAELGPAELSMARIAERMGLATSAMYRHFPGKDALYSAGGAARAIVEILKAL